MKKEADLPSSNTATYGWELIINASGCDPSVMTREDLTNFITNLCQAIDMKMALEPFFWDEVNGGASDEPHLKGTSVVQFIETSNIVIHTLTILQTVFLNIFSCKEFDPAVVEQHVNEFFKPQHLSTQLIERNYVVHVRERA